MQNPLLGRRIHIAGSISKDVNIASAESVKDARELVSALVKELIKLGAVFVVPVDVENLREDDKLPICFDWLIWQTIKDNLHLRPAGAPLPLVVAVQHHKTEEQIPSQFHELWDSLRESDLVKIENAANWNMASKRMEAQARWGDVLISLGGDEGILLLANLYHQAGKPVIPINLPLCDPTKGARKLFNYGLTSDATQRLFRTKGAVDSHAWLNRINFPARKPTVERTKTVVELLEALEKPKAFVVRLLNDSNEDYVDVENFFQTVVRPVISDEFGYDLVTIDSNHAYENSSIVQEIFGNLHSSSLVIADITGMRPNCFIELGYALGRNIPTLLTAKKGTQHPFDVSVFYGHHWQADGLASDKKAAFKKHWEAIKNRAPLVPTNPLIP